MQRLLVVCLPVGCRSVKQTTTGASRLLWTGVPAALTGPSLADPLLLSDHTHQPCGKNSASRENYPLNVPGIKHTMTGLICFASSYDIPASNHSPRMFVRERRCSMTEAAYSSMLESLDCFDPLLSCGSMSASTYHVNLAVFHRFSPE